MNKQTEIIQNRIAKIKDKRKELIRDVINTLDIDKAILRADYCRLQWGFIGYVARHNSSMVLKKKKNKKKSYNDIYWGIRAMRFGDEWCEWSYRHHNVLNRDNFYVVDANAEDWKIIEKLLRLIKYNIQPYIHHYYGTELDKISDNEKIICEDCGVENPITALYCNGCGTQF